MSERKLVTIQTVTDIQPIANADNIEQARVMGWTCVVKKGEFRVGDQAVFFEIDSVLPDGPEWSEFMRPRGFRVKTIRLRGVLSQGLALPLDILPSGVRLHISGLDDLDLSGMLGVSKYEPVIMDHGSIAGPFPARVPKTDEIRLQSCLGVLDELKGHDFYVTTKCDGASATYLNTDDGLIVASRNWALHPLDPANDHLASTGAVNAIRRMANLYRMDLMPKDMAIQGEVCGPGIQKNRLNLTTVQLFVFNVYDVRAGRHLDYSDMVRFCDDNGLQMVPLEMSILAEEWSDFSSSLEDWLERAKGLYRGTKNRKEGIVVRPMQEMRSATLGGRLSFKVLNDEFLLKDED